MTAKNLKKPRLARNLACLSPLMKKGGKFASEKPNVKHRQARRQTKKMLSRYAAGCEVGY